jgi:serine/threonine-protein kinase
VGEVIAARYRLVETLGDGAMGKVFVAEDEVMGRRVAVKLLKPELLADDSFRKRFQHEAMAIAAIEHRNVARFIDLVVGDPTFLVMEFVPGPTLGALLKRERRLEPLRAIKIAQRLCWALDAVHDAGIVHRDIKPANVVLAPDREADEEPKLIDFGLAKLAFATPEEQLTRAGQFVGTPHYMSPEQIASRTIDARADVYSLGCLLYHLIAGQPPFHGSDDVQVLYKQMEHAPPPLSGLAATTPPELDDVLARALAKEPGSRFASTREMAAALHSIERSLEIAITSERPRASSRSGSRPRSGVWMPETTENVRLPPPRRRPKRAIAVGLGLALGLAAAVGITAFRLARASRNLVVVTSLPTNARVRLDDRLLTDPTPTALTNLTAGAHRLRLEMPGRIPVERALRIADGERAAVDVVLPPESRALEVTSIPAGAAVFLDGVHTPGETPLTLPISDDDFHELRLEKLGYEPETAALKPEDRGPIVVSLVAEKEPRGVIWVEANSNAEVFIDGKDSGFVAPTVGIQVAAGTHALELRDPSGARGAAASVALRAGESIHVTLASPSRAPDTQ